MLHRKPLIIIVLLSASIIVTAAGIKKGNNFKNLKILPQDISEAKLDSIMDSYNKALKVGCDFCHVKAIDFTNPNPPIDWAKDGPMKENGRRMIRMMIDINKNYFYFDKTIRPEYLNAVSCNTCHRGNPFPLGE